MIGYAILGYVLLGLAVVCAVVYAVEHTRAALGMTGAAFTLGAAALADSLDPALLPYLTPVVAVGAGGVWWLSRRRA
jgi:hypothetical protein